MFRIIIKSTGVLTFLLIVCFFNASCVRSYKNDVSTQEINSAISLNNKSFIENVKNLRNKKNMTTLQELTDFEWDEVYQFLPYTYPGDIVGNLKGVEFKTSLEGSEEENILFVKDNNPVCYIYGTKEDLNIDINIWDYADSRGYVKYKNSNINTLIVDDSMQNCIKLFVPNKENEAIYSELFQNIDKNNIIYSYPEE